ncbi:MAG: tRNA (N6-threonylcarbamoyladenosine(37)-N6)-methyltransferase TrmO [Candidatus Bathyarchaeia archaeon]
MAKSELDSMVTGGSVVFRPVGVVRTMGSDDDVRFRSKESESTIEIYAEFQEALEGLQGFSHIFVLGYLNKLRPDQMGVLKVKPRRLLAKGFKLEELPLVGVFAIDSPTRPNPIGLTLAELVKIDGGKLVVRGLDFFDGTPILDIKPYRGDYRAESYDLAHWYGELRSKAGEDV